MNQQSGDSQLNKVTISQLELLMGDKYELFVNEFISNTSNKLANLTVALKNKDTDTLYRTCHSLKGASGTIGAEVLAELARQLEILSQQGTLSDSEGLLQEIETAFDHVKQQLLQTI